MSWFFLRSVLGVLKIVNRYTAPEKTRIATRRRTGCWTSAIDLEKSGETYTIRLKQNRRMIPESPIMKFDLLLLRVEDGLLLIVSLEDLLIT
jgi:hypothetical protein